jgi:hypothetical protein
MTTSAELGQRARQAMDTLTELEREARRAADARPHLERAARALGLDPAPGWTVLDLAMTIEVAATLRQERAP